jgi:hypothetical protein
MPLLTKTAIAIFASLTSFFILSKPPAPTAEDLQPSYTTVYEAYEAPVVPTSQAPTTTLKTPLIGCDAVFEMAKHVGWDTDQLGTLIAVAQRESRCQFDAFNPADTYGQSYGVMQINDFWCKPSRYFKQGYLQAYGLLDTCQDLFDLETNMRAALNIYRYSNGWRAWGGK